MERDFVVTFMGKKCMAHVNEDTDDFYIRLPLREENGQQYYESITRGTIGKEILGEAIGGWQFSSLRVGDPNYRFNFWILDNGRRICNNPDENTNQYRELNGNFSRTATPKTPSEKLAKNVYETIKQAYEASKLGVLSQETAESIGKLRKRRLDSLLKLMGYSDLTKVKEPVTVSKSYFSLRRVGRILEEYENLAFVYPETREDGSIEYLVDYTRIPDKKTVMRSIDSTRKQVELDEAYMDDQDELIDAIREISAVDEFHRFSEYDLSSQDNARWNNYANTLRKVAMLVLKLNYDFLPQRDREIVGDDFTDISDFYLADEISKIIYSTEFEEACKAEDNWMIEQYNSVETPLQEAQEAAGLSTVLRAAIDKVYREVLVSRDEIRESNRLSYIYNKKYNNKGTAIKYPPQEGEWRKKVVDDSGEIPEMEGGAEHDQ